jgi:hypothetical protein
MVDDKLTMLPLPCDPQFVLHAQKDAEYVGVEGGGVAFGCLLGHRPGVAFGTGVVDGNVEAAKPGDGLVDQILYIGLMANVGSDEFSFGTGGAKLDGQGFTCVIASAGNDDACAFFREGEGRGAANASQCTGDQDDRLAHVTSPRSFRYAFRVS